MQQEIDLSTFANWPDDQLLSLAAAERLLSRSRVSLYRDARAGRIQFVKVGKSTRIRVGELRRIIGGAS